MPFNHSNYIPMNFNSSSLAHFARTAVIITSTTTGSIPLENRPPIKATLISLYALIFFFGITGNALVVRKYFLNIYIYIRSKVQCLFII